MPLIVIRNGNIVKSAAMPSDKNGYLRSELTPPCLEEYSNHLGKVDNFTETAVEVNGTATEDAANHEMDLSTGLTSSSSAIYRIKKTRTLSTKPIIANFIVTNIVNGVAGTRQSQIGLAAILGAAGDSTPARYQCASFQLNADDVWRCKVSKDVSDGVTQVITVSNGDLLTIVATSSTVKFYQNGTSVFTVSNTTHIPTSALYCGAAVSTTAAGATTARSLSIDFMSTKLFS